MKISTLVPKPDTRRVFTSCLLAFSILITPIAALAAKRGPVAGSQRSGSQSAPASESSKTSAKDVFVNPPVVAPPVGSVTATMTGTITTDTDSDSKADPAVDTITYTATITNNTGADVSGMQFTDTVDPHTTIISGSAVAAGDDAFSTIGNVNINVPLGTGVLANDFNPNTGNNTGLTVSSYGASTGLEQTSVGSSTPTAQGGTVTIQSDGSFIFDPKVGFTGTDTFKYTSNQSGSKAIATVRITVTGMIWFVKNDAAVCTTISTPCGTLAHPFSTLAAFQAVNDAGVGPPQHPKDNDNIFIYTGVGNYTGGVTLRNGQKLIGQGATASIETITSLSTPSGSTVLPTTSGTNPVLTTGSLTDNIRLGTGNSNLIRGFTVGDSGTATGDSADISGTNIGTLTVSEVTLNGSGRTMNINGGALSGSFTSVTSTASTGQGLTLGPNLVTGSLNMGSTTISGWSTGCITVSNTTANVNFGNTSCTGGTGSEGVNLTNNGGGTRTFGTLTVSGISATAFIHSTGGGDVNITGLASLSTAGNAISVSAPANGDLIDFQAATTATTSGNGVTAVNWAGASGATMQFSSLSIQRNNGAALNATTGGTINVTNATGTINNTTAGGPAIVANAVALNANFTAINSSGGTNAVSLTNVSGTSNFGTGALSGSTGATFLVSGGTATVTYSGGITQATAGQPMVSISGHATGTITFQTGTLSDAIGTGLLFDNADGVYNFNGTTTLNGGDAGVDIQNGSGGTFSFSSNTSITNPTNTCFRVNGSTAGITYSGNITRNAASAGLLVDVTNEASGTITFQTGTLSSTSSSGSATGITLNNADGTVNFNGTNTLNGGNAHVQITNGSAGTFSFSSNSNITSPSASPAFDVSGGSASAPTVTYSGNITQNTSGQRVVNINTTTGNGITFNTGTITGGASSTGININAADGNVTFSNGFTLGTSGSRMTNQAVTITSGGSAATYSLGTMSIFTSGAKGLVATNADGTINCGSSSTIDSSTATAIDIDGPAGLTTLGMTLVSVNSAGGTADGISIQDTNGSFTITGDGANTSVGGNSTGGTISGKSGADSNATQGIGIYLNNVTNITLRRITINGTNQNYGIKGTSVSNFTLEYSTVNGTNGTVAALGNPDQIGEGSLVFGSANANGITGTGTFTNLNVSGGRGSNLIIENTGAVHTATVTVKGSTFGALQSFADAGHGCQFMENTSGATMNVVFGGTLAGEANTITSYVGNGIATVGATGTTMDAQIRNNNVSSNHAFNNSGSFSIYVATSGVMTAHVTGNTMRDANGSALVLFKATVGTSLATFVDNNTIGVAGIADSGSKTGNGIFVSTGGAGTISHTITNNQIHQIHGNAHLYADNTGGSYAANFDIRGNTFDTWQATNFAAMAITNGAPSSGDTINVCAVIGGTGANKNTFNIGANLGVIVGSSGAAAGHTFNLPGYAGGANLTNVQNFIAGNNTMNTATVSAYADAPATAAAFTGNPGCGTPSSMLTPPTPNKSFEFARNERKANSTSALARLDGDRDLLSLLGTVSDQTRPTPIAGTALVVDHASGEASASSVIPTAPRQASLVSRVATSVAQFARSVGSMVEPTAYAAENSATVAKATTERSGEASAPATRITQSNSEVRSQRSDVRLNHARSTKAGTRNSGSSMTMTPFAACSPAGINGGGTAICVDIPTIHDGQSITISFQVTVKNPPNLSGVPPGTPQVSNFGTVTGPFTGSPLNTNTVNTPVDLFNSTTTLGSNNNPAQQGDSITFTATVAISGSQSPTPPSPLTPTGTVTFKSDGLAIGGCSNVALNGSAQAQCTTSALTPPSHNITAEYSGDGNYDPSTSNTVSQTVNACNAAPVVTKIADTNDGTCDGDCSLREAIATACTSSTITFDTAGVFSTPQTITLGGTELSVNRSLTINAPAAAGNHVTVSGNNASRIFNVGQNLTVNISNLTTTAGNSGISSGGAIVNNDGSTLTLTNMTITASTAGGGGGVGNICSSAANPTLIIKNSTITGNTATGLIGGGGLYHECSGTMYVDNSTIDGNNSTGTGGGAYGAGGISINAGAKAYISNSTISNNTATAQAGGLFAGNSTASDVQLINTTVSGNSTNGNGGGLYARATLVNSTITNNRADADNNASGSGGGIFVQGLSVSLLNTIVAGNFSGSGSTASDIAGSGTASGSFNLIGTGGSGGLTNGVNNNQVGVADAGLGALANNGGATMTHKLLSNSTAIEAGTDVTTLSGNGGSITNVATTVNVADATAIPQNVTFVIQVDNEQMSVTSKSGNTLTVVRGVNGTTAATHNDGAAVNPAFDQRGSGFPRKADSADANTTQTVDIGAYELHPTVEDIPDKSTAEDTPFNFNFNIGDGTTSPSLITSVTATSNNAALIPNANLSVTGSGATRNLAITPVANANSATNGTATITVTVTATNGQTATDTFVVTVTDVNDPPNVTGETIGNIAEDCASGCTAGKYVIPFATLLSNDNAGPADEQGSQTITITNVGSAVGGSVAINGTDVEFTPTADYNGAASFQYTVTDNGTPPAAGNATASFTITEVNDPPVATDDSLAGISEDCASGCTAGKYVIPFATLTGNDSKGPANESTQTLTITLVNNAVGGTVAINGTNVEFTPTANFNGTASFDYTVQDNGTTNSVNDFKTDIGSVSFPVTAIADTPSVTNSSTNEDTQTTTGLVITINAADGPEVTHFKITNITNGSLFKNDGTTPISNNQFITVAEGGAGLKFTPTANFNGIGSFDVAAATDGSGSGLSGTATAQITVGSIGDVPGVTNATTNEDNQTSSGLVITKNAADGVDITVFKITNITNGTLFQNNGTTPINNNDFITIAQGNAGLKFTPNANLYSSVSTFSFDVAAAKDNTGAGLGNTVTATITVNPIADTPSVSPNPATTAISTQTGPLVISRNAADGSEVTHFKITNITHGILYQSDGTTPINNNDFITFAQGNAGLKFTPTAGLSSPGDDPFSFEVQASLNNTNGGLGGSIVTELINVSCSDPQVVTSTLDDGSAGTLRYAINNSCPNTGTITFNLPAGPQTITLGSPLTVTKTLSITGPSNQAITINGGGNRVFDVTGGSPTIANLTITGAVVSGSNGGGLRNSGTGTITLNAMTFTGNSADNGGAIALTAGTIIINNSTISGNTGNTDGGGVWVNGGTLTLLNDTITNNTATAGQGGGLRVVSGTANVRNTIIAGNTATSNANVGGTINDQGNNILAGNPKLAALANNGGPTMTHALLPGSPALDAGDNTAASSLTTDQRGNTYGRLRDAGSDADTTQTVDIGAFEADPSVEDITDKATSEDTALPSFSFNVGDSFSAFDSITATSSNTTLVPNANVVLSGSGSTRSLSITPAANQSGNTTITVTVTKTVNSTVQTMSDTFVLTVGTVPDTPSITNAQTDEDVQSTSGLVVTKNAADGSEVNNFKIVSVTGGTLFKSDGVTPLPAGSFITISEGGAGMRFTPTANSDVAGTVTVQASTDNVGTVLSPNSATGTITIVPIADTPSVTNATTNEDTPTSSGLVVTRNAADGAEVTHFKITNITNGTVFKNGGTVQVTNNGFITVAEGNAGLQFRPAANLNSPGTTFSFQVQAATNGAGVGLSSGSATATITVNAVNDVPSFTKGADQTVLENSGPQTVNNWATGISAGPSDESGQTLTFQVTGNTNPGLFSAAPAISSTGTLTYTPANNVAGTAQITINLKDNGGTSNGGVDTSATQTFNITVTAAGYISLSASNYNVNENVGSATVIVNRAGDTSVAMTIDYATSDGTAKSRSDYNSVFGTLRFEVGDTQKTIMIPITQDAFNEGPEGFTITLSNPTGAGVNLVVPSAATITISDSPSPTPNAIDDNEIFVRQHYHDFLNREADPAGLAFWVNGLNACSDPSQRPAGQTQAQCLEVRRILTSAAFFLSIEFMQTGTFVRNVYVASLDRPATGNMPAFNEWLRDTQAVQRGVVVGQGNWQATLDANRLAFINDFVMRAEYVGLYPTTDTPTQYVDKLYAHAGVSPANPGERNQAINEFGGAATASDPGARGRALIRITQNSDFRNREFPRAFVQMEYFGYLRRNPNDPPDNNFNGYNFWVNKLIQFNNDFFAAEMVKAFLTSSEYRSRFGP